MNEGPHGLGSASEADAELPPKDDASPFWRAHQRVGPKSRGQYRAQLGRKKEGMEMGSYAGSK